MLALDTSRYSEYSINITNIIGIGSAYADIVNGYGYRPVFAKACAGKRYLATDKARTRGDAHLFGHGVQCCGRIAACILNRYRMNTLNSGRNNECLWAKAAIGIGSGRGDTNVIKGYGNG